MTVWGVTRPMYNRILDISDSPARLRVKLNQLVLERRDQPAVTVPLAELAVLIVSHPQVSYTQAVLANISAEGGVFVTCDERRLPVGILLPLQSHYLQTQRIADQASVSVPTRKRLWQQIVRAKINAQADLLERLHDNDHGLRALVPLVKSGDPANVEARAARRYWNVVFGSNTFRRDRNATDQNRALNYGYAVLRAITARAICAAGLHPSLGLHHHNQYNAFCLADDLMEPFRVIVDQPVAQNVEEYGSDAEFGREARQQILETLTDRTEINGESRSLFDTLATTAGSLASAYRDKTQKLILPERLVDVAS